MHYCDPFSSHASILESPEVSLPTERRLSAALFIPPVSDSARQGQHECVRMAAAFSHEFPLRDPPHRTALARSSLLTRAYLSISAVVHGRDRVLPANQDQGADRAQRVVGPAREGRCEGVQEGELIHRLTLQARRCNSLAHAFYCVKSWASCAAVMKRSSGAGTITASFKLKTRQNCNRAH